MEASVTLGFGPKENALLAKKLGRNPAAEAETAAAASQDEIRDSGLQWEKTEGKDGKEGETRLARDSVSIGATTVTATATPEAIRAETATVDIRQSLTNKFVRLYEGTYANCFSHNRLVAKVAAWTTGNILGRLALLGTSPQELAEIRERVRDNLITQNKTAMAQVLYDETMLEIVA